MIDMLKTEIDFKVAAVNDGWSIEPLYSNGDIYSGPVKLKRDGFVMLIFGNNIDIWGPDGTGYQDTKSL